MSNSSQKKAAIAHPCTAFPNILLDNLNIFSSSEFLVMAIVYRKTIGTEKNSAVPLPIIHKCTGLSNRTSHTSVRALIEKGFLEGVRLSDQESADRCKSKTPSLMIDGHLTCLWCKSTTVILHEHHYPVRDRDGGVDTVSICASCHAEFHYLSEVQFYRLSKKFLALVESGSNSLEETL